MFCMLVTFCVLFQPTRPRGARPHRPPIAQTGQCGFNPRAHEGRDHDSSDASGGLECFNPRAHEGRDRSALNGLALEGVSTHAPTRGATTCFACWSRSVCCFNPRAHEGRDLLIDKVDSGFQRFNPRAHEGRDPQ